MKKESCIFTSITPSEFCDIGHILNSLYDNEIDEDEFSYRVLD